jgi:activating signal cointegrator complex subunit 1
MSLQGERLHQAIEYLHSLDIAAVLREAAASSGGPTKSSQISDKVAATETRLKSATPRLRITVKGLESMHSPQSTSILYAVPKDTAGTLYAFCLAMQDLFKERGFLVDENRKLKLHATIVNTIYAKGRKPPSLSPGDRDGVPQMVDNASSSMKARRPSPNDSQGHGPKANAPLKMDASLILEKYKDFVWADDVLLDRIAVCEMGAKKIKDTSGNVVDEQYTEIANRPLIL